ncbi:hypothetical protein HYX07_00535 [Candidatus Woesearchaeota archaeon]|nr:hypothetical protein [Candidatus Woesearchaeota archaeon]
MQPEIKEVSCPNCSSKADKEARHKEEKAPDIAKILLQCMQENFHPSA